MCRTRKAALSAALAALLAAPPVAAEDLKPALKAMTEFLALDGRPIPAIRPQEPVQIRVSITSGLGGGPPAGLELFGWLRRVDDSDLPCGQSAEAFLRTGRLPNGTMFLNDPVIGVLTEDSAFIGAKSGVVASAGALTLDSSSQIDSWASFDAVTNIDAEGGLLPTGTYTFATGMNLGAIKLVRLRSVIDMSVLSTTSTIDARLGDIDRWDNFDGADGGEVDVVVEARTTTDDPAGSPTWGNWGRVDSTETRARGVQARAILTTSDASFSPSVTQLRLVAEEAV